MRRMEALVLRGDADETLRVLEALSSSRSEFIAENLALVKRIEDMEAASDAKRLRRTWASGPETGPLLPAGDLSLWKNRNTGHVNGWSLLQILSQRGHQTLVGYMS